MYQNIFKNVLLWNIKLKLYVGMYFVDDQILLTSYFSALYNTHLYINIVLKCKQLLKKKFLNCLF